MNLYLIQARTDLPKNYSPWDPWYDKAFGFVVRAEPESMARKMAADEAGDEDPDAWLDSGLSVCTVLSVEGAAGVIIRDFASA